MYRLFEKLLHPSPEAEPPALPKRFFPFLWACMADTRGYFVPVVLHSFIKHQMLAINVTLRLRRNFHRMMPGQSGGLLAGNIEERQDAQAIA